MKTIELIYDRGCPHVEDARAALQRALGDLDLPLEWQEWDREAPEAPPHARNYGSPTVLVDGRDVSGGGAETASNCCRVYHEAGRLQWAPSMELIRAALREARA